MKPISQLSAVIVGMVMSTSLALAQDKGSSPKAEQSSQPGQKEQSELKKTTMKARADLEERIAKAHKNAASCLKSGQKSEKECDLQLSKECEATGASEQCMPKGSAGMAGQASPGPGSSQ